MRKKIITTVFLFSGPIGTLAFAIRPKNFAELLNVQQRKRGTKINAPMGMKHFLKYFLRPENETARLRIALAIIMALVFILFQSVLVYALSAKWLNL